MSWTVVARVFRTKVGSPSRKAVLVALADRCDETGGNCFPGQDAIHEATELSLDTIQRQIDGLLSDGFITRKKRPGVRGRWSSWSYQIDLSKLVDRAAPCGSATSDQAAPCGVTEPHHAVSPGRTMRLEPSLEPINEPSGTRPHHAARSAPTRPDGLGARRAPVMNNDQWDRLLSTFVRTGRWTMHVDQLGNAPPAPDCKAPRHLLIKHGLVESAA